MAKEADETSVRPRHITSSCPFPGLEVCSVTLFLFYFAFCFCFLLSAVCFCLCFCLCFYLRSCFLVGSQPSTDLPSSDSSEPATHNTTLQDRRNHTDPAKPSITSIVCPHRVKPPSAARPLVPNPVRQRGSSQRYCSCPQPLRQRTTPSPHHPTHSVLRRIGPQTLPSRTPDITQDAWATRSFQVSQRGPWRRIRCSQRPCLCCKCRLHVARRCIVRNSPCRWPRGQAARPKPTAATAVDYGGALCCTSVCDPQGRRRLRVHCSFGAPLLLIGLFFLFFFPLLQHRCQLRFYLLHRARPRVQAHAADIDCPRPR